MAVTYRNHRNGDTRTFAEPVARLDRLDNWDRVSTPEPQPEAEKPVEVPPTVERPVDETPPDDPPPTTADPVPAGNASRSKWADYATSLGVGVSDDHTRDDIKDLVSRST